MVTFNMYLLIGWQGSLHIGGKRINGVWRWQGRITGEITYNWWSIGEPSNDGDCMSLQPAYHKFNDLHCDHILAHFLCERIIE